MLGSIVTLLLMIFGLMASGCGSSPQAAVSAITTATTPVAASVTQTFTYAQGQAACTALKAWDPTKTNIQLPGDPGNAAIYLFTAVQITQNGQVLTTDQLYIGVSGTNYCIVNIAGGKIVSIQ